MRFINYGYPSIAMKTKKETRKKIIKLNEKRDGQNGVIYNGENFAIQIKENDQDSQLPF